MPRGIAWDDLPNHYAKDYNKDHSKSKEGETQAQLNAKKTLEREINWKEDAKGIGKRIAFGVLTGGLTGAAFGFVEVLRNSKLLSGRKKEGTKKILGFTYRFAGFFGFYHGARKTLALYVPLDAETNVASAAFMTVTPMIVVPSFRPMIPYAICMIIMDAINGLNDV